MMNFFDNNGNECSIIGRTDVIKENMVYELKFVSELSHTHFLQLACYLVAMEKEKGILWNVKNNDTYEVKIPARKRKEFMDCVIRTITKGSLSKYTPFVNRMNDKSEVSHVTMKKESIL